MMRTVLLLALLAPIAALAADPAMPDKTEDDKSLYAMGYIVASRNFNEMALSPRELRIVIEGLSDSVAGKKSKVNVETQMATLQAFAKARASAGLNREKAAGLEFVEKAAKEPGAVKVPVEGKGFFVYRPLTPGTGPSPIPTDTVSVDYEGRLIKGVVFDSSYSRGVPAEFGLNHVIRCWTLGVAMMKVGEKAQLTCPSEVAYGDDGSPPSIPGGATLVFTVELRSIKGHEVAPVPHHLRRASPN